MALSNRVAVMPMGTLQWLGAATVLGEMVKDTKYYSLRSRLASKHIPPSPVNGIMHPGAKYQKHRPNKTQPETPAKI
jgi:hypothetical protein